MALQWPLARDARVFHASNLHTGCTIDSPREQARERAEHGCLRLCAHDDDIEVAVVDGGIRRDDGAVARSS